MEPAGVLPRPWSREPGDLERLKTAMGLPSRRIQSAIEEFASFVAVELRAYRPGRTKTAARIATIVTAYAAVMACLHVQSPTAQYALWLLLAPPSPMLKPRQALALAASTAALCALSVPIAGALSEAPGLMIVVIGAFTALTVYAVNALQMGARGFVLQLAFLEAFYNSVVVPENAGFLAANTFAGYILAIGIIFLFDAWLWPNPAEPILAQSLSFTLRKESRRLLDAAGLRGEKSSAGRISQAAESDLAAHLSLLQRVAQESGGSSRRDVLLGEITRVERIFTHIEHLSRLAYDLQSHPIDPSLAQRVRHAMEAAAQAVREHAQSLREHIKFLPREAPTASKLQAARRALVGEASSLAVARGGEGGSSAPLPALGAFVHALEELDSLLTDPHLETSAETIAQEAIFSPARLIQEPFDPTLWRFSLKTAAAVVLCFILGFASHDPRLWVAPVTVFTVAFPAYGTAMRRMLLRLGGSALGGLLMVVILTLSVSPGVLSLPGYLLVIFPMVFLAGYTGLSSEKIAYAGRQIGDVFIILFMGIKPLANIYDPFWRAWGIFLGILVPGLIYYCVWPQHAGEKIPALLARLLRNAAAAGPHGRHRLSKNALSGAAKDNIGIEAELLALAADARFEGRSSGVNPNAVVESIGSLRALSHHFIAMTARRREGLERLRRADEASFSAIQSELLLLTAQLELWSDLFKKTGPELSAVSSWNLAWALRSTEESFEEPGRPLDKIERALSAHEKSLGERVDAQDALSLHGEIARLRDLGKLLRALNESLAMIPIPASS